MFNVRLAGGHLYGKQLFTWLSRVVSFIASFVLSFFPLDVLDGIWDLIESVSEGFLTYTYDGILGILNLTNRYDLFYVRLYYKMFAVNLTRTTQTISLQRDNYNIKMCLNSSEISIFFSSANTVSSINLILNIPGCFLYKRR